MRIFLVGFMGAGKSVVGRQLAEMLGSPFLDLDDEIEAHTGMSVAAFFASESEEEFRKIETERLVDTLRLNEAVIATGGGIVTREENRRFMAESGTTVWLNPDFSVLSHRLGEPREQRKRPLYQDVEVAENLWRSRLSEYGFSNIEIAVGHKEEPATTASRIVEALRETCAT